MPPLQDVEDTPRPASAPTDARSPAPIFDRLLEAFGEAERLVELISRRLREVRDLLREEAGARPPGCRPGGQTPSRPLGVPHSPLLRRGRRAERLSPLLALKACSAEMRP